MHEASGTGIFRRRQALLLIMVAALALLCYLGTIHAPFQWDESRYIADNPTVKGSPAEGPQNAEFEHLMRRRPVGMLSFGINYAFGRLAVEGYHAVNIALHAMNAALLYALMFLLLRSFWADDTRTNAIAFFSAAFFAVHPMQSEAVNYVYQRHVLLAAFFTLAACLLYAIWSAQVRKRLALYILCIASSALAMKSKESAFTLPLLILAYDVYLSGANARGRIKRILPIALTSLLVPLGMLDWNNASISGLLATTTGAPQYGRLDYFLTQPGVVLDYMRLLMLPVGQNIFHAVEVKASLAHAALPMLIIVALLVWAIMQRASQSMERRLMGFGILWFLIALSVESSIIPIPMLMNEYRVYLPAAGLIPAMVMAIYMIGARFYASRWLRVAPLLLMALVLVLSVATVKRNMLWQSRVALWRDAAQKSPAVREVRNNYGLALRDAGRSAEAAKQFIAAVDISPSYSDGWNNLGLAMLDARRPEEAAGYFARAISTDPKNYRAFNNMGNALRAMSRDEEAMAEYRRAIELRPDFGEALSNLGTMLAIEGRVEEAMALLERAVQYAPDLPEAHYNLAGAYMQTGRLEEAAGELARYLDLRPDDQDAWRTLESLMGE